MVVHWYVTVPVPQYTEKEAWKPRGYARTEAIYRPNFAYLLDKLY
jgi:hypothetical protein